MSVKWDQHRYWYKRQLLDFFSVKFWFMDMYSLSLLMFEWNIEMVAVPLPSSPTVAISQHAISQHVHMYEYSFGVQYLPELLFCSCCTQNKDKTAFWFSSRDQGRFIDSVLLFSLCEGNLRKTQRKELFSVMLWWWLVCQLTLTVHLFRCKHAILKRVWWSL